MRRLESPAGVDARADRLLFGLFELTLRLGWVGEPWAAYESGTELYRMNALLGWSHRANTLTEQIAPEFRVRLRINSLGLREDEVGYDKPADVSRIVWLGDSFTFGSNVDAAQRCSDRV